MSSDCPIVVFLGNPEAKCNGDVRILTESSKIAVLCADAVKYGAK